MALRSMTAPARMATLAAVAFAPAFAADAMAQGSVESDRAALEAFYDATGGPGWSNSTNWKTSAPLDEWYGVTARWPGRVTELSLHNNGLTGSIPPALGNLGHLQELSLGIDALTGPIPDALGSLTNLESLYLAGAGLTGPIPGALGSLVNLRFLNLGGNALTGPIPAELGGLVNLEWLELGGNDLTGSIPGALGNLVNLERLSLSANALTGPIPGALGSLVNLRWLHLGQNALTVIPVELGSLVNLEGLNLAWNALTGQIPAALGSLVNLRSLGLPQNWGLSGPLPQGLQLSRLRSLAIDFTQVCAPADWRDWLATIDFDGGLCGTDFTIDVSVFYTEAAREAAGGSAEIAAVIDLMVAETNQVYAASGVHHRIALVDRSEVRYTETGSSLLDLERLTDPSDGHMDGVHALRDRVGADLVHLILSESDFAGRGEVGGAFGVTVQHGGVGTFAHELGHNMGLLHDRYEGDPSGRRLTSTPEYGYVNQRGLEAGAQPSSRWRTIMAYPDQCDAANVDCAWLPRFSNPRQRYNGDPMGVPFGIGGSGLTGPADASAVLNATGPAAALWRDRPAGANRPPVAVETLPDRELTLGGSLDLDASPVFVDPDGDALTYTVSSSAPDVVTVLAAGARVSLAAVGAGTATIRVTATDPGGLSASHLFAVAVPVPPNRPPEPVGGLVPVTLAVGEAPVTVDVAAAFRDPDGDRLTYGATSSAPNVATVSVSGSRVTLTPVSAGTAMVTVTATDPGGSNTAATQTFTVTVTPPPNRPPEPVGRLAPVTLAVDEAAESVEVSGAFRDPDDDALTYAAMSSAPGVASVSVSGSLVTVTPLSEGMATVTVTATDAGGSNQTATQTFRVTVNPLANRPPEPVGRLAPVTLAVDEAAESVEVSGAFRDPDDDALTYGATSSSPGVASVSVSGSVVTVTPLSEGTSTVTVTATDTGGSNTAATQSFTVTVGAPANRPPEPVGVLAPLSMRVDEASATVEVSGAFRWDGDGDGTRRLRRWPSVTVSGSSVTVTPLSEGTSTEVTDRRRWFE